MITTLGIGAAGALTLPASAFLGAAVAGVVVFAFAATTTGVSAGRLVMVGIAIGHLLGGVTSFLILRTGDTDATQQILYCWSVACTGGCSP